MASVRNPHHGEPLADPMNLSWRHAALGLVLGALLAGGALAAAEWLAADDAAPPAGAPGASPAPDHGLDADARCAHMPEHCAPPTGAPA